MKVAAIVLLFASLAQALPVDAPAGINHTPYDRLLKKYVNDRGLVDYATWKTAADDLQALRDYTGKLAAKGSFAEGAEKSATLINAYNALTLLWILDQWPVNSIKDTANPWDGKRHVVGGRKVSLDEIEHDTLRPSVGYRVHACLVCAAKSCPPLRNAAYQPERLDEQLDERMRGWLDRPDLNQFSMKEHRVYLSKIFDWYRRDFDKERGGLRAVLLKYAPKEYERSLQSDYDIRFKPYDWALNRQSPSTASQ